MPVNPHSIQNEIIFMPSLQIVSKVVGKKISQAPSIKRATEKHNKKRSPSSNSSSTSLTVGSKVKFPLSNKTAYGTLRFIGPTKFSSGLWCGIELSRPDGRNNGTVKGVKYFQCKFNYGIFVHEEKVTLAEEGETTARRENSTSHSAIETQKASDDQLGANQLTSSVDDEWVVFGEDKSQKRNPPTGKGRHVGKEAGGTETHSIQSKSTVDIENAKSENDSGEEERPTHPSVDDEANDMRAILAGEVGVENSPLTIKIAKSVSEDDNNNSVENAANSDFDNGLLFYVTAHQTAPISRTERHKSCPVLSSSSDEEIFGNESKWNTWPKYPKDEVRKVQDKRGPTTLRRRLSGIEKRIRLSHFRTPSPGTLKRSLSQSAVYPKENYVSYEVGDGVDRLQFSKPLKRSVSDVTGYNTCGPSEIKSPGIKKPNSTAFSRRPRLRRERTAPDSFDYEPESESDREEDLHDDAGEKETVIKITSNDEDDHAEVIDISSSFVVVDEIDKDERQEQHNAPEAAATGDQKFQSSSFVDEDLVIIDKVKSVEEIPVEYDILDGKASADKEPLNDRSIPTAEPSEEAKPKPSTGQSDVLRKTSPGQTGSSLPVFVTASESKIGNQSKSQITVKSGRKTSVPVQAAKKESTSSLRPMWKRISHSQVELTSKTEVPKSSIEDRGRLPKKLNRRVSDLVANFEKPKDKPLHQKGDKTLALGSSSLRNVANEKKSSNLAKHREAASDKDGRKNGQTVVSRKPSQVSQEELAGKEALSKQYFKEDANKKPGHVNKVTSSGFQTGRKSSITTPSGRSGIPGYGKRAQKAQIETPRKSFEFIKSTTSKQEKQIDSHQPTTLKDKSNIQSKSNDQKQIEELKNKCIDCEKQIDGLKVRVNEKNLALEAFIVVIKQHIKTIEDQSRKHEQLQHNTERLNSELKQQRDLAVSKSERCKTLDEEIACISDDYIKEIETLKAEHEEEFEFLKKELNEKYEGEMGQANAKFDKEISKLKDNNEEKITKLLAEHEEIVTNLREDFEKAYSLRDEEFMATKDEYTSHFETEKEEICLEYEERLQDLQIQLASAEQQCSAFETKSRELQTELDRDLESKIQGAIAKYKDLPAELESLQAVVEMKNEDIRKARMHNMELQKKLEDYYELEKKYVRLSQEKEAIDAALKNKAKCERQLSVEKESLQANLEKEARKVKRLSMEKEELMWKVSNSNSSLSLSSPSLNVDLLTSPNGFQSTPNSSRSFNRSMKTQSLYLPPLDDEEYTVL